MKINELAKILKSNPETIRMYRNKGLLKPLKNPKNGYYEYTDCDLFSLFFIRKLRGSNLSLPSISHLFTDKSITETLDYFNDEIENLEQQKQLLERKLDSIRRSQSNLTECISSKKKIHLLEFTDAKLDILDFLDRKDPRINTWLEQPDLSTLSLCIRQEWLNQEFLDEFIPASICLGTYQAVIEKNQLPILDYMSVCPKGTYLCANIELHSLSAIPRETLLPFQHYAKVHHLRFISNTTAFLIRIDRSRHKTKYLFRIRAQVEHFVP